MTKFHNFYPISRSPFRLLPKKSQIFPKTWRGSRGNSFQMWENGWPNRPNQHTLYRSILKLKHCDEPAHVWNFPCSALSNKHKRRSKMQPKIKTLNFANEAFLIQAAPKIVLKVLKDITKQFKNNTNFFIFCCPRFNSQAVSGESWGKDCRSNSFPSSICSSQLNTGFLFVQIQISSQCNFRASWL